MNEEEKDVVLQGSEKKATEGDSQPEGEITLDFSPQVAVGKVFNGSRKSCSCRVSINPAKFTGQTVNGMAVDKFFVTTYALKTALFPLKACNVDFPFRANTTGGGHMAIAHAVSLALARAQVYIQPEFKPVLRKHNLLTVDSRKNYAKLPGRPKSRKLRQKSKR